MEGTAADVQRSSSRAWICTPVERGACLADLADTQLQAGAEFRGRDNGGQDGGLPGGCFFLGNLVDVNGDVMLRSGLWGAYAGHGPRPRLRVAQAARAFADGARGDGRRQRQGPRRVGCCTGLGPGFGASPLCAAGRQGHRGCHRRGLMDEMERALQASEEGL